MKNTTSTAPTFPIARRKLYLAIAAQMLIAAGAHANPTGGVVVAGDGQIDQSGLDTTITQTSDRMAIDWASFNIQADERVQFIQPGESSVALNRILGSEASQIFGRLDANGHVILMNPNGVLFGESATVNVGGLVASGLAINPDDFMNGDFALSAVEGMDGAVINQGIINAATGGNIVLVGRKVENQGLISAKLGSVTLAAGKESVLTFDNQGLIGVRVSKEILQHELGVESAVTNSGEINAEGGRILLTGSVSQDIFSSAVNSEGLNAKTSVVMHDDGSFTLGAGADVVNTGTLNASADSGDAGQIVVIGENIQHSGAILANNQTTGKSGDIELHAKITTLLTQQSTMSATALQGNGGTIKILGDRVGVLDKSQINASGTQGGGDILIGGGFQGKNFNLRNASRTVVGKDTEINADALQNGDGGEVIVWADQATAFTGKISVRGGSEGGDGGFVEVSGKENLTFDGRVDRTAVEGKSGFLLLDPETITIVPGNNGDTDVDAVLIAESEILFTDTVPVNSNISATALRDSLLNGNTILEASGDILFESGSVIDVLVDDSENIASLIINAGGNIQMQHNSFLNVGGDIVFNAGVAECGGALCDQDGSGAILIAVGAFEGAPPMGFGDPEGGISALGDLVLRAADGIQLLGDLSGSTLELRSGSEINLSSLPGNTSRLISRNGNTEIHAGDNTVHSSGARTVPLGPTEYILPALRLKTSESGSAVTFNGTTQSVVVQVNSGDFIVSAEDNIMGYRPEISILDGNINIESFKGDVLLYSPELTISKTSLFEKTAEILLRAAGNIDSTVNNIKANVVWDADADQNGLGDIVISDGVKITEGSFVARAANFSFLGASLDSIFLEVEGPMYLAADNDLNLPTIWSGGDVYLISELGSVIFEAPPDVSIAMAGDSQFIAGKDVIFSATIIDSSETGEAPLHIRFDVSGDLLLESPNNGISSIEILNAQNVVLANRTDLNITSINAQNLRLDTPGNVTQTGAINVSGESLFNLSGLAGLTLENAANDFNEITINSSSTSGSRVTDGNDLLLNNITASSNIQIISQGGGALVSQKAGSQINLAAGGIMSISADNIHLGESDSSIQMEGGVLTLTADESLSFSGALSGAGATPSRLSAFVNAETGAELNINEGANFSGFDSDNSLISLGDGDDIIHFAADTPFNIEAGAGNDAFTLLAESLSILNLNGNDGNDTFTFSPNSSIGSINAGAGDDTFILANNITTGLLDGGGGEDTLNRGGLNSIYTYLNELIGGDAVFTTANFEAEHNGGKAIVGVDGYNAEWRIDGDSTVTVTANNGTATTNSFNGVTRLEGGTGDDNFILLTGGRLSEKILGGQGGLDSLRGNNNLNNQWIINGINSGELSSTDGDSTLFFEKISNLVGGGGSDTFDIVTGGSFIGSVSGSAGSVAVGSTDTLRVSNVDFTNTWTLGDVNTLVSENALGEIFSVDFSETQILAGNANLDTIVFSGTGNLDLLNSTANEFSVASMDHYISNGGTIQGTDFDSIWILNQEGSVTYTDATNIERIITFNNFTAFEGGLGLDEFIVRGLWTNDKVWVSDSRQSSIVGNGDDSFRIDIEANATWYFSTNPTLVYLDGIVNADLVDLSREEVQDVLSASSAGVFSLTGIKSFVGSSGSDAFFVLGDSAIYGASDAFDPIIDGANGEDFLLGFNYGVAEDLIWRIMDDFSGRLNEGVFFTNIEHLKSNEYLNLPNYSELRSNFIVADGAQIHSLATDSRGAIFYIGDGAAVDTIIGGVGLDIINTANSPNIWELTETGGTINNINFTNIENLNGGSDVDEFVLLDTTVQAARIDGAGGANSLTSFEQDNVWEINAVDSALNTDLIFNNINDLVGSNGVDIFSVNAEVAVNIVGGGGNNSLLGVQAPLVNNIWAIDGISSGALNTQVIFQDIQNISGNAGDDTFTFSPNSSIGNINAGAGDDTFILANNITTGLLDGGEGQDTLNRDGLNSIYTYLNEVIGGDAIYTVANIETETSTGGSTTVVAVDGYDAEWIIDGDGSISVTATDTGGASVNNRFTAVTRLEGGAGADEFILLLGGVISGGVFGSGDDSLQASDTTNTWTISGGNAGQLAVQENNTTLSFEGIASLIGGAGSDLFDIAAGGSITGFIDGGAGTDTLQISDAAAVNNWQLGLENSLALVNQFRGIENLVGNANNDVFVFTSVSDVRKIEGNGGDNTLNWSADEVVINLCGCVESNDVEFKSIQNFVADASFNNTIIGLDETNAWTLTRPDSGRVNNIRFAGFNQLQGGSGEDVLQAMGGDNRWNNVDAATNALNESLLFSGMERLIGGADADDFSTDLIDVIAVDGGLGSNQLLAAGNADNNWLIDGVNSGSFNSTLFQGISSLIGGSGSDIFDIVTGGAISGSIDGGAGADTFTLAAGTSVSEIYGGAGNDNFVIGRDVTADNFFGDAGDDSFDVDLGLVLSGALDGGSGGEDAGDYLNLNKYTVLTAATDLEALLGFAFRNFERIDQPNNQGVYSGGDASNFWYITGANQGRLEIRDGANAGVYEFSGVHSLLGGSGEDVFIFADDTAAITTIIDGGVGAGENTLDLSAQSLINQWLIDGASSGRVINDSNATGNVFTNIAYLVGGSNRDIFSVQAAGAIAGGVDGGLGDDQLAIASTQTSTWALGGEAGNAVTGIALFENIETLIGSAGEDTFNVLSETLDVARVDGAGGTDTLNFQHGGLVEADLKNGTAGGLQFSAVERLIAGNIGSTLIAADASNSWTLDSAESGSIRYLISTGGDVINVAFDGFGNLVGGAADDQFTLQVGASVSGAIDAGAGNDGVSLQAMTTDMHVATAAGVSLPAGVPGLRLNGVEQLLGNGRTWLYGASDQSYTWNINGSRSGQVTATLVDADNQLLAFENLSAIVGGAHDDIFQVTVAAPLLSLDGGAAVSADLVDYSQVNGNLRINLATALSGQNGVLTGVEGIRGNNAGPDSIHTAELVGADGENFWTIGANGSTLADGVNDGQVTSAGQTIQFLDFNQLTGGAGVDRFELDGGVLLGTLNGGAGDDVFDVALVGANTGTLIDGGLGLDSLTLNGGDVSGLMTYTATDNGGEFDYSLADTHFSISHQAVETIRDNSRAQTLEIRGSSQADIIGLANGSFRVNGGDAIEHTNKTRIAVRSGINDTIEITDHLVVADTLTLANGTVIANDPANNSITTAHLVLDATRDVGLASARLRTSVDELSLRGSAGDTYLQEQNGLNLAEFNANGVFDLLLLNGDLTSSAPLSANDVFRVSANNGDITLLGDNQLRDDVALAGRRVELQNASTITLVGVTAEDLILRIQRGIEGDGPLVVSGLTEIDAQGDVRLDFASNDFNRVRVTNAWNLTLVDQNSLQLLDINASGTVVVRSANHIDLNDSVAGGTGVDVTSGSGSINQNGSITTGNGSVVVSAGNGEVNLGDDARIVSNGGSVNISAGNGNVNMGADTRIAANGGNVNIEAAESVVVAEVVSTGNVTINAGSGNITDGNGGTTNVVAGTLQSSSNTGFGSEDSLETQVGSIDITTSTGNVGISNKGDVKVESIRTDGGSIAVTNEGNVDLAAGAVSASNGDAGGDVNLDVSLGSVKQSGSNSEPAITGGTVLINAPEGSVGEGGLRVFADVVRVTALVRGGEIFVNPGADKIEYFSGSFKFEDQLLSVEPLDDIDPAIFSNVRTYFYNDISLLMPSDQRFDEEEEETEE